MYKRQTWISTSGNWGASSSTGPAMPYTPASPLHTRAVVRPDRARSSACLLYTSPYCWKTPREGVEALSALKRLTTQVGFDLHVFRRSPA